MTRRVRSVLFTLFFSVGASAIARADGASAIARADVARAGVSAGAITRDDVARADVDLLVFSKTAAFRHGSIPVAITALETIAAERGWTLTATEDATAFTAANLATFDAVVFLMTTGDVLDPAQQNAFESYIRGGGGYVGVHSASDTEYSWPWYGELVGAYFVSHPAQQTATIVVTDRVHPASAPLPERWSRFDEWYNFDRNPRGEVHVLMTVDESSYSGGGLGYDHPIAWCHDYDGGRSFYTGLGHTDASYGESEFRAHLQGGIEWAAGAGAGECNATIDASYLRTILEPDLNQPLELDVAGDGRVFFIERTGAVRIWRPATGDVALAGRLTVHTGHEDGLLGLALDPDFQSNGWIYLYYSPAGPVERQNLSRFTVTGDTLDLSSETILLEIPTERGHCCHAAGSLQFDPAGNLFIAVGDNTYPFDINGYSPIDERPGNSARDAQRTAASDDDLRGKILRIRPQPSGVYTIPPGNLFPQDGSGGRPEIFAMGVRNPFRLAVDPVTGTLYWGEVGPDADADDPARGPRGYDELNRATAAGNFGWPYITADHQPYIDFDFATQLPGPPFDPAAMVNDSPNNTGARGLPPASAPLLWYSDAPSALFPELASGDRTAMAGPIYRFDPSQPSPSKLPRYFDQTLFFYEWSRNFIKAIKLDQNGQLLKIDPFLTGDTLYRPVDLEQGPDGALYLLEWGIDWTGTGPQTRLSRIAFRPDPSAPVARAAATPRQGALPLMVSFSSLGSYDPDGDPLDYAWDFDGDGTTDSTNPSPRHTYDAAGVYAAALTVSDPGGSSDRAIVTITAGNSPPVVTVERPPFEGGFADFGDEIHFRVRVDDLEDGSTTDATIACADVRIQSWLGHGTHAHPLESLRGCRGRVLLTTDHEDDEDVYSLIAATYDDLGGALGSLTSTASRLMNTRRKQAEFFSSMNGVTIAPTSDPDGGHDELESIDDGDWIALDPINTHNIDAVRFRVASAGPGGRIEVRRDDPAGRLLASVDIAPTGGLDDYADVRGAIADSNQHLSIDFGSATTFDRIVLDTSGSPGDGPRGLQLWTSSDGSDFHGPLSIAGAAASPVVDLSFHATTSRYLRVIQTGDDTTRWWSVHELDLYTGGGITRLDRSVWTATASTTGPADSPAAAIDGDPSTRWSSGEWQSNGSVALYFLFLSSPGATDLFDLNWIEFEGRGIAVDQTLVREPSPSLSNTPLRLVKLAGGDVRVVLENVAGETGYVVYDNLLGTHYGTPTRTCIDSWTDQPTTALFDLTLTTGDKWLVVAAANARGESSCGQDVGGRELNQRIDWPATGPCP